MSADGFFLIFNFAGYIKYENGTSYGPHTKPRVFSTYAEAYKVCMDWAGMTMTKYEQEKSSRFIARVGSKICAEFLDKEGHRIVWSDHPGFPATEGYGEPPMRTQ